jgi:transposase
MARSRPDPKTEALRQRSTLHPHPECVRDEAFLGADFFDPRDLLQVKYEMLRRVRSEGQTIRSVAEVFGVSRPTFYAAQEAFEEGGLAALLPKKPGPRRAHKLREEIVDFLRQERAEDPALTSAELAGLADERFGLSVHPRSIERALARRGKKRR